MRPPRVRISLVEQHLHALEHLARNLAIGHEQPLLERVRVAHARERLERDVEVLAHPLICLFEPRGAQLRRGGAHRRVLALHKACLQIARLRVVSLEAEVRHPFRIERADGVEHHAAIAIAALDPRAIVGGGVASEQYQEQGERKSHNRFSSTVTCDSTTP